jgi:hypothetical protein
MMFHGRLQLLVPRFARTVHSKWACTSIAAADAKSFPPIPSILSSSAVFDFVDKIGSLNRFNENLPPSAHRSISHVRLMDTLLAQAACLLDGRWKGERGLASAAIVGAKGIGKSTVLRMFACLGGHLVPGMTPVYISYAENTPLRTGSLMTTVKKLLDIPPTESLYDVIRARNLRLFLMVDELDQVYRVSPQMSTFEHAVTTLYELAGLGDQASGRICTLICSSSPVLPLLITCDASHSPIHRSEFPLLSSTPNLNGQKYRTIRLPADLTCVLK